MVGGSLFGQRAVCSLHCPSLTAPRPLSQPSDCPGPELISLPFLVLSISLYSLSLSPLPHYCASSPDAVSCINLRMKTNVPPPSPNVCVCLCVSKRRLAYMTVSSVLCMA